MAEPEKNFLQQLIDWVFSWKASFDQLRERVGWLGAAVFVVLGAAVAAGFYIWSNWKDIKDRPGVQWILARFKRRALPGAPAGHLTIAVAHLERDKDREHENLLLDELRQFEGVKTISVDYTADPEERDKNKTEKKARSLLKQTGADVLIWGGVISLSGKSAMRLYWMPTRDVSGAKIHRKVSASNRDPRTGFRVLERPEADFRLAYPIPVGRTHLRSTRTLRRR
jgi:hypothetical protein